MSCAHATPIKTTTGAAATVSNWILTSCQPHGITWGRTNAIIAHYIFNSFLPRIVTAVLVCWSEVSAMQRQKADCLNSKECNLPCIALNIFRFDTLNGKINANFGYATFEFAGCLFLIEHAISFEHFFSCPVNMAHCQFGHFLNLYSFISRECFVRT